MVKSKNPIKSTAISARPPGPQAISPSVGESPDLLNLISRPSSRTGKCAHPRGRSASKDSRQTSHEPSSFSEEEESGEEEINLNPKTPTTSRVLAGKLSHRIVSLQLPAAPSLSAPEGRNVSMSWDDQVTAEKSRNNVSGASVALQASLPTGLVPHGPNHGTAESSTQLGGGSVGSGPCDVTGDHDHLVTCDCDNLPNVSQPVTSSGVTSDITHDYDFWDGGHHVTSLSGNISYLDNDAKVLAASILYIARFIQKHPIGSQPLEQFPPILGAGSIMWILFQAISKAGWDRFKISPHPNVPLLVEAMRTVYGPSPPHEPSLDVEMAVDEPAVEETSSITVTNKKRKAKGKIPSAANPSSFQNAPPAIPAMVSRTPLASAHPEYESLLRLRDMFPDLPLEKVLAMYQSGFGVGAAPSKEGATHPSASRAPKMTTHGPTRHQVLIPLDSPTSEIIVANAALAVESCNRGLVDAHSKLRVESVRKAWDSVSMSTNFVASAAELEVIKQWLKQ